MRKTRVNLALVLLGCAIVFNIVILAKGDGSAGWPLAAIVLLGAAGASLVSERREL